MNTQRCRGMACFLICAWLWLSGLLLMGKILSAMSQFAPGITEYIPSMEVVGSLQVFFLFYTAICVALYFLWRKLVSLNGKISSLSAHTHA